MTAKRSNSSRPEQAERDEKQLHPSDALRDTLRKKYEDVKDECVPDKLQRLIDALREAEHMSGEKKDS